MCKGAIRLLYSEVGKGSQSVCFFLQCILEQNKKEPVNTEKQHAHTITFKQYIIQYSRWLEVLLYIRKVLYELKYCNVFIVH